ncbi:helix-turn-helix domain-containing protein [Oenococcus alcoholitolerans]|uniref:helix-turn-helix domain-containing protein n=1 Tax=Oenococcus alcoholitolerans TaxID=931074 RepID=UPI003F712A49
MKDFGEIISDFRENKGMSQAALARGILSNAQLSKFERGVSSLTVEKFYLLLDRLSITPNEFAQALDDEQLGYQRDLLQRISKAVITENMAQAKLVKADAYAHYQEDPTIYNQLFLIMMKSMIHDLDGDEPTKEELALLSDYLFKVEEWTGFELLVYGNSMSVMKLDTINTLSRELIVRTDQAREVSNNFQLIISLLYNTVLMNLDAGDLKSANKILRVMRNTEIDETKLPERFMVRLAQAITSYYGDPTEKNRRDTDQLIDVLRVLGCDDLFVAYKKQFEAFINETK